MSDFNFQTTDGAIVFQPTYQFTTKFNLQENTKRSDTQGFQHKVQVGRYRIAAKCIGPVTNSELATYIFPMREYQDTMQVQFDRNAIGRASDTLEMTFDSFRVIKDDLPNEEYVIELNFTEVVDV